MRVLPSERTAPGLARQAPWGAGAAGRVPRALAAPEGPPDVVLILAVLSLVAVGLVMVLSSSYTRGLGQFGNPFHFFLRQIVYGLMGLTVAAACQRVEVRRLKELAVPLMLFSYALLVVVLAVGQEIGGARRWIALPFVNVQPSELAKLACINFAAAWAADRSRQMHRLFQGPLLPLAVSGFAFALILLEPDFGTAVVVLATTMVVLFAGGMTPAHLAALGVVGAPVLLLLVWAEPYRVARLVAFVDPWADPTGRGWSIIQSLLAIGSGGLFGLGLGQSRQKFYYLPEHHTDFIFAILAEELGLVGGLVVLGLFGMVAWRGFRIALGLEDRFEQLLSCGLASLLVGQALLNIGVVSGSVPATGIPLPFVSYGGSSMVSSLAAVGMLVRLSRRAAL